MLRQLVYSSQFINHLPRKQLVTTVSEEISIPTGKKLNNALNNLSAKDWVKETISVFVQRGLGANHKDAQIEKQHPAPFSFQDIARLIVFFTKKGGLVLDPFVGVGSTLKACAYTGRQGVGIELNQMFVDLCKKRMVEEVQGDFLHEVNQEVIHGDASQVLRLIPDEKFDFVVTSPPYWNILKKIDHKATQERVERNLPTDYGNDARDPSNAKTYEDFIERLCDIMGEVVRTLKRRKYVCIVVSDFRHKDDYYMFHCDLANRLRQHELKLKGITILYQKFKRIFPYGYPYSYVPNIHHQYILIMQRVG